MMNVRMMRYAFFFFRMSTSNNVYVAGSAIVFFFMIADESDVKFYHLIKVRLLWVMKKMIPTFESHECIQVAMDVTATPWPKRIKEMSDVTVDKVDYE